MGARLTLPEVMRHDGRVCGEIRATAFVHNATPLDDIGAISRE